MTTKAEQNLQARLDIVSKYKNKKVSYDGYTFDSKAECKRYKELRLLEQAGEISKLVLQPEYVLLPDWTDSNGKKHRAIIYRADFAYMEGDKWVVEDVKGISTKDFKLKAKLFQYHYRTIELRITQ